MEFRMEFLIVDTPFLFPGICGGMRMRSGGGGDDDGDDVDGEIAPLSPSPFFASSPRESFHGLYARETGSSSFAEKKK